MVRHLEHLPLLYPMPPAPGKEREGKGTEGIPGRRKSTCEKPEVGSNTVEELWVVLDGSALRRGLEFHHTLARFHFVDDEKSYVLILD